MKFVTDRHSNMKRSTPRISAVCVTSQLYCLFAQSRMRSSRQSRVRTCRVARMKPTVPRMNGRPSIIDRMIGGDSSRRRVKFREELPARVHHFRGILVIIDHGLDLSKQAQTSTLGHRVRVSANRALWKLCRMAVGKPSGGGRHDLAPASYRDHRAFILNLYRYHLRVPLRTSSVLAS